MRVLVCGGRDFDDAGLMISVLERLHIEKFFTVLIHGNARGADSIADAWASCRGIPREPYEVPQGEWDEIGKKLAHCAISGCSTKASPIWLWRFRAAAEQKTWSGARSRRACQYTR
jgi:hypothetical protein